MRTNAALKRIEKEVIKLSLNAKLELLEKIVNQIKNEKKVDEGHYLKWDSLYGLGKGIWKEDAQKYVSRIRKERKLCAGEKRFQK
jgi:hypothetical protein